MVWIIKHYRMEFDMNEIPVFIKASTPLILYFTPVIPANLSYTWIHVSVCKYNPSKRSPRSSKICIWMSSITCYNTSAIAPETTQSQNTLTNQKVHNIRKESRNKSSSNSEKKKSNVKFNPTFIPKYKFLLERKKLSLNISLVSKLDSSIHKKVFIYKNNKLKTLNLSENDKGSL